MKNNDPKYHDQIPDYLDGSLNKEEELAFEAALVEDATLQQAVELQSQIDAQLSEEQDLMALLQDVEKEVEVKHSLVPEVKQENKRPKWWLAAAALVLLTTALFLIKNVVAPTTHEDLLATYHQDFIPLEILPTNYSEEVRFSNPADTLDRSLNPERDSLILARTAFAEEDFKVAKIIYQELYDQQRVDLASIGFEYGILLWSMKEYSLAVQTLEALPAEVGAKKYWYLALAQLGAGDRAAARASLTHLATLKSPYLIKANDLLSQL